MKGQPQQQGRGSFPSRCTLLVVLAVALLVWFANIDYRKLVKSDEGRYAEIAREMAVSGDWITPRLNDFKYFYKPPLQYWATAAFYKVFGIDEWSARLWTALTGLMTVCFTGYFAARLFGRERGVAAAAIAGSCLLLVAASHFLTLDMGLACFMTLTLGSFLLAQRDEATPRQNRNWMLLAWAGVALGVLSKGLPALVLPGAVLFLYVLWERDWALVTRLHLVKGSILLLAIAAPWFVAVSLTNPEFARYFFYHEHVERFLTRVHGRWEPWWYFIPILLAGLVPWTLLLFASLLRGWRRVAAQRFQPERVLWLWAVFIFVFFSASSSKLALYIVPILPALAVLMARPALELRPAAFRWALAPIALLAVVLAAMTPSIERYASNEIPAELMRRYAPWIAGSCAVMVLGIGVALWLDVRGRRGAAVIATALAGLVFTQGLLSGHNALAPSQSAYFIAQAIRPHLTPGMPLYSVNMYDHTLNFYIGRTVTLVQEKNELEFGIAQEPERFVATYEEFTRRWAQHSSALAITSRENFARQVSPSGLPLVIVAQDTRRVVFRKP